MEALKNKAGTIMIKIQHHNIPKKSFLFCSEMTTLDIELQYNK